MANSHASISANHSLLSYLCQMRCSSGKKGYYTEPEVQEALIRSHISFRSSATNYYVCEECGEFHLTSKINKHPLLNSPEVISRIKQEQQEQDWQSKLR